MDKKAEKEYWDRFYSSAELNSPSSFAEFCQVEFLKKNEKIIDIGCGTGRDTLFFFKKGHQVVGVDQSSLVISQLQLLHNDKHESLKFVETDFTNLTDNEKFDVVYSRLSFHSIDSVSASRTLKWAYRNINDSGKFLLEVRSVKDDLYGKGKQVERDAFVTTHYRRFIRLDELFDELKNIGFKIKYSVEQKGLARFKDEDPIVIRMCAEK
jgi:ubiquinone/menaquinone biosynthesis C-methylase UbiE